MIHEVILRGYAAHLPSGRSTLLLGTEDSYGLEQLHLTLGPGWEGYTVTATFVAGETRRRVLAGSDGTVTVPPEATASGLPRDRRIVFTGVVSGKRRISADLRYTVSRHSPADGEESAASPGLLDQILSQVNQSGTAVLASAVNYDANVKAVNHRGYNTEAPENTIPAYILSKKKGFRYVECDVSFTSDGVAVLLHDNTIDRTSNGTGSIASMTYADALRYDFGSWKSGNYAGTKIPTFDEFILTCKGLGLHPYIELKNGSSAQIAGLVKSVHGAGMKGKVTYISFSAAMLGYVRAEDSAARLGYLGDISAGSISAALGLKTAENEVFLNVRYTGATEANVALCLENGLPLEVWTVNSHRDIRNLNKYISGVTSDSLIAGKVLYEASMVYTATEAPSGSVMGIFLDKEVLSFESAASQTIYATLSPGYSAQDLVWSSSDETVVRVENGVVTPVSNGNATVTAAVGDVFAECQVTVNISTAAAEHTITRNLTGCTSSSDLTRITDGGSHTETLTAEQGYELETVTVTMAGADVTADCCAGGTVSIGAVTGNVVITAAAAEREADIPVELPAPAADYDFAAYDGSGTVANLGTGGSGYDAAVYANSGAAAAQADGIHFTGNASMRIPVALTKTTSATIAAVFSDFAGNTYNAQRIVCTDTDVTCFYWAKNHNSVCAKLANSGSSQPTIADSDLASVNSNRVHMNKSYFHLENLAERTVVVFTLDGTNITLYLNGVKMAWEDQSKMAANAAWLGLGNGMNTNGYNGDSMTACGLKIYDSALSDAQILSLSRQLRS